MHLRRAARNDANHATIVQALRKAGGLWVPLGHPVDGVAGFRGRWVLVEIKDGSKPPSKRRLRDSQLSIGQLCELHGLPFVVAESPEGLLRSLGLLSDVRTPDATD